MQLVTEETIVEQQTTIFVVDDDPGVSRAMASVGQLLDLPVSSFSSATDFLAAYDPSQPGCLILDIKMPDVTGLELQQRLVEVDIHLPIIMISGHADVRIAVEAMSRGALTLLEKPCRLDELTTHIRRGVDIDSQRRRSKIHQDQAESKLAKLTPKEREVLDLVASGKTNKAIAEMLSLSTRAVEDRRSRVMKKLGVRSIVELMQLSTI